MTTATAAATHDARRITESDADFQRIRAQWERRLLASVRQLQRDIAAGGEHAIAPAQSAFIHRHVTLLRDAYVAGHSEGQRDYWGEVSNQPARWARERHVTPAHALVQRRLLFYASASVVKLAREVATLWHQTHRAKLADLPDDLAWNKFTAWASPRIGLQADITWSGFQDGYLDAATADNAGLKLQLWWELEPGARHCDDCPSYADASPYDPPGSGGNELDATPGDGHTACGANCKCSLRYGWTNLRGVGLTPAENEVLVPPHVTPPTPGYRQVDVTRVQSAGGAVSETRDITRVLPNESPSALAHLTAGQRQALDDVRGIALLWDAIRGPSLPDFEVYFDPESGNNLWRNPNLDGLSASQRELVERFFRALGDWQDATPIDEA